MVDYRKALPLREQSLELLQEQLESWNKVINDVGRNGGDISTLHTAWIAQCKIGIELCIRAYRELASDTKKIDSRVTVLAESLDRLTSLVEQAEPESGSVDSRSELQGELDSLRDEIKSVREDVAGKSGTGKFIESFATSFGTAAGTSIGAAAAAVGINLTNQ
ncbi:hypothetical protein EJ997_10135 [Flaviflexus ciconiae]|uniref:Uncharacterized protein n=1 Tax=Flaviflexus ciconiae TaxID=2496867 RepID=A0A3Q9G564_9ACTO|nr:hypothetical protein [Flaviflexus ciconiae]AZQ77642.1 hypothetical protein EJ997_10135 [Flaviflexus ciconiae]